MVEKLSFTAVERILGMHTDEDLLHKDYTEVAEGTCQFLARGKEPSEGLCFDSNKFIKCYPFALGGDHVSFKRVLGLRKYGLF